MVTESLIWIVCALLFTCGSLLADDCVDGVNNVITVENINASNPIVFVNSTIGTYDSDGNASCYKSSANLYFPGEIMLLTGYINVTSALTLINNSIALLTIKKNSDLVGTVCQDGKSQNSFVSDEDCKYDLCGNETALCKMMETPGVYNISDLQTTANVNTTIQLPDLPDDLPSSIVSGQWHLQVELQVNGTQTAFKVNVPPSDDWLYVEE